MSESEFDRFADEYHRLHAQNIQLSGEQPEFFARYKAEDAARLTRGALPKPTILDFGSGIGNSLPFLRECFPQCRVVALDVSRRSLEIAQERFGPVAEFRHFEGSKIPAGDGEFGMAFAACVFHHIEPDEHIEKLREIHRVLAPGGWLILHEHNPRNPLTVRAVRDCPFDERAQLVDAALMKERALAAGFNSANVLFRVFFPAFLSRLRFIETALTRMPFGAQYCLSCRKSDPRVA